MPTEGNNIIKFEKYYIYYSICNLCRYIGNPVNISARSGELKKYHQVNYKYSWYLKSRYPDILKSRGKFMPIQENNVLKKL